MATLDFQSLLRQEKALRRAELAKQASKDAAQREILNTKQNCPAADPTSNETAADESLDEDHDTKKGAVPNDVARRRAASLCFADLAGRPLIDMDKASVVRSAQQSCLRLLFLLSSFFPPSDIQHIEAPN